MSDFRNKDFLNTLSKEELEKGLRSILGAVFKDEAPLGFKESMTTKEAIRNGFHFFVEDDTVTIYKYTGDEKQVAVPAYINGFPVTELSWCHKEDQDGAFFKQEQLEAVFLPPTLHSINAWTFYGCTKLQSIQIPKSCNCIRESAFEGCENLKLVTFEPDSELEYLHSTAFANCPDINLRLPDKNIEIH